MSDPPGDTDGPVGSVSDEALKLFGVLSDWAREANEHVATNLDTGSTECTYCPICRTVHAVRQANPEVRAHLAGAAASLLQAAAGLLATAVPPDARTGGRSAGVERIDLATDGAWPEEDDQ